MARIGRFEDFRYIGTRDTMRVYDCDDPDQYQLLERRIVSDGLIGRDLVQAFGPDTIAEAANRGFRPIA